MKIFKKLLLITPVIGLFFFAFKVSAAAPDGAGPWADSVFSSSQGVMKNGQPVPAIRSNPTAALGVAENTLVDGTFFSLGFGGKIELGFDNGVSNGAMVVESTNPGYPIETAKVEMSQDGTNWVMAGNLSQSGTVNIPEGITCAKYVRITDTSDPANYPDAIADGYDVDGVKATGDPCTPPTSTPAPTPTDTTTPAPSTTTTSNNTPGFPNTGGAGATTCTSAGVTTVPQITDAHRLSPTSISVSWGPNAGLTNFIVEYGFTNGNWQFNTKVNGFTTIISNLPANQSIWIHVAATDNCAEGSFGTAVLVGGTPTTNTPGFPNTGSLTPGLPDTGIGPDDENVISTIINHIWSWIKTSFGSK